MEDSETREREHEVEEFMALLDRIESEKRYRKEMKDTHKRDSVKISQTWLSSFQWEDFNKVNNVDHPFQSQGDEGQQQSHGDELEDQQCAETGKCMKRKRESSPADDIVDNKMSCSKENNNNQRVIAAFDLNLEGESAIPCSMGLSL